MLAEVRLVVSGNEARLVLKYGDTFVEDELWRRDRRFTRKEAEELCRVVFDDSYDLINNATHGEQ